MLTALSWVRFYRLPKTLTNLAKELKLQIFEHLPPMDLATKLRLVSRECRVLANDTIKRHHLKKECQGLGEASTLFIRCLPAITEVSQPLHPYNKPYRKLQAILNERRKGGPHLTLYALLREALTNPIICAKLIVSQPDLRAFISEHDFRLQLVAVKLKPAALLILEDKVLVERLANHSLFYIAKAYVEGYSEDNDITSFKREDVIRMLIDCLKDQKEDKPFAEASRLSIRME